MPKPSFRKKKTDENEAVSVFSNEKYSVGTIRKTQLITTFGVGAIVDFKDDTVVIASTDDWDYSPNDPTKIEERKIYNENLSVITGAKYFLMPKTTQSTNSFSQGKDVRSYIFPEKQHCSRCGNVYDIRELDMKKRHECPQCKNRLTASRFIIVCQNGHMDDFPYSWWVHAGKECPSKKISPRIKMKNIYNRTDVASLMLECSDCGAKRGMMQVFSDKALTGFPCTCNHPHFKDPKNRATFGCKMPVSVRLRSQSGVYFSITKSALLIPPWSKKAVQYMQKQYTILKNVPIKQLPDTIRAALNDSKLTDEEILRSWDTVQIHYNQKQVRSELSVYKDEYKVLSNESNESEEGFSSYSAEIPAKYSSFFDQIAVVDKLIVTQAFTGFTRTTRDETFKVDIAQYPKEWLPAVELKGEGIFIRLNKDKVAEWVKLNNHRYDRMGNRAKKAISNTDRFSAVYVLIHTLSHLFIREISNICGYSAASIKEKIYADVDAEKNEINMCGFMVFVSSSDSGSSLGGLISIADNSDVMERILDSMLERAEWCSGDPLCISSVQQGYHNLNYAACHDCALLPETSCETFNVFLDRAAIIGLKTEDKVPDVAGFFEL